MLIKDHKSRIVSDNARDSGIDIVGSVPWGTHFCQFYKSQKDLLAMLIPYFAAGLKNNEYCIWVTSEFLTTDEALKALKARVPNFSEYYTRGQIEVFPHTDWYLKEGKFELTRVLNQWVAKHDHGLASGYSGVRVSGNPFWIDNKKDWDDFAAYEAQINKVIGDYKLLVLCTYSLDKCGAGEIIDVVTNHEFAIIKRSGRWELIETAKQRKTKEALEESRERLRTFLTVVSHELKNPLTPIVMALNLIEKRGFTHPDTKRVFALIKYQSTVMAKLLKDLSDISRIERGKIELDKKALDLSSAIKNAVETVKPSIKERKQILRVSYPKKPITIAADPLRLQQALTNLLSNASKFSSEKTRIIIRAKENKGSAYVTVKDHGIGISKEFLPKIFNLFSQGEYLPNRKKGLGIGLYLSRELARLQGGDLYAASAGINRGSEFTLKIPIKKKSVIIN